jgi:hypothetical protein
MGGNCQFSGFDLVQETLGGFRDGDPAGARNFLRYNRTLQGTRPASGLLPGCNDRECSLPFPSACTLAPIFTVEGA